MERLTKENVKEMGMYELSHNQVFVKDGWAWYRDYEREVSAVDLAKEMFARNGIEYPTDQEDFDEYMLDLLSDGYETVDGMIAMIYRLIWSMADIRESLKAYEDTGLTSEQVSLREDDIKLASRENKEFREEIFRLREELKGYRDAEKQGLLIRMPDIKLYKTLYWIWGNEVMPVKYMGIHHGCLDESKKYHVVCRMHTKKDRTFIRGKKSITFKTGDERYFYADDIGKTVFFTREAAAEALKGSGSE